MSQSAFFKKINSIFFALVLSLLGLSPHLAWGVDVVGSFPASATVVQPLTIASASTLNFGSFVAGGGGTVTIPSVTPFTRTSTGASLSLVASNPGSASTISVSGVEGRTYTVTLPTTPTQLTNASGGATMAITTITSNLVGLAGTIPASGAQTFQIGGTLTVGSAQPSGTYSANLPITISYN
jgi:hypothetical protein